jgi:L-seryl-tRNA(Ser) seleniumtransferase
MSSSKPDLALLQQLPSIDALLLSTPLMELMDSYPRQTVVDSARAAVASLRLAILESVTDGTISGSDLAARIASLPQEIRDDLEGGMRLSLRPVINATGVLLHTNLGRAPLSQRALDHIAEVAIGYCNLELDLETGERSRRDVHTESLVLHVLRQLAGVDVTDDYAVVIVNNCAAATFLALNTIADGKEVIVSRGELVEIGGGFRIPEILAKSGAQMREVGTTNRTRTADYERALSPNTAMILRVHQSNFSMEGFTARPPLRDLIDICGRHGIPLFDDQGTGLLSSLDRFGTQQQETLPESFRHGSDLIAASGDKLLGGPQCGLLIGKRHLIDKVRQNPLLRTFRVDKLTYAALEATLLEYLAGNASNLPIFRMLNQSSTEIEDRCLAIAGQVTTDQLLATVTPVMSVIGGGTTPSATVASHAITLRSALMDATTLHRSLRTADRAVLARISGDVVLLDLRTVDPSQDELLIQLLLQLSSKDLLG